MNTLALFPDQAARSTGEVDAVFLFIVAVGLFFFFLTQGFLIYFAIRYRRRRGEPEEETPQITENGILEFIWVVIPSLLVLAIFVVGWWGYRDMVRPIPGAMEINVTARQWLWEFTYPDGRKVINELRIPVGKPVKLTMTSTDVLHGFFIPDYRLKQDILPGRYTHLWLQPEKTGTFVIFCSQYCGTGHSAMMANLVVVPPDDFARWQKGPAEGAGGESLAHRGEELVEKSGCLACHSLDGSRKVGPTFKGVFGHQVELEGGSSVVADENYLKESIVEPNAKIVKGYPPVMPTFKGTLSDDDIAAIIAYLKTLK
ncbi:cytochrome c oxidase subunit II [Geobacter pickeringii]|uniref:Cytochrome c oxidase subunit 2 n=1 Tax=Geobacter pickeringii TaxID=345632 RepID=A0A0B5BCG9_9BACT|nr:cytochrome c oxidase subunit II [Geobacter pickeringii]AJE04388.1 hypothetical protein GPICK_14410 [Geobacter pickeringii]